MHCRACIGFVECQAKNRWTFTLGHTSPRLSPSCRTHQQLRFRQPFYPVSTLFILPVAKGDRRAQKHDAEAPSWLLVTGVLHPCDTVADVVKSLQTNLPATPFPTWIVLVPWFHRVASLCKVVPLALPLPFPFPPFACRGGTCHLLQAGHPVQHGGGLIQIDDLPGQQGTRITSPALADPTCMPPRPNPPNSNSVYGLLASLLARDCAPRATRHLPPGYCAIKTRMPDSSMLHPLPIFSPLDHGG